MIVWQTYRPTGERDLIVRVGAGTGHFYDGIGRLNLFGQDFAGPLHDVTWTLARSACGTSPRARSLGRDGKRAL